MEIFVLARLREISQKSFLLGCYKVSSLPVSNCGDNSEKINYNLHAAGLFFLSLHFKSCSFLCVSPSYDRQMLDKCLLI